MYNVLVIIFVVLNWVQSYDIFLNDVSVAYGNNVYMAKTKIAIYQLIMRNAELYPME